MKKEINQKPKLVKTIAKESCDCYIGNMDEQCLFTSTVKYAIKTVCSMQNVYKDSGLFKNQKALTALQIIDNRRGYVLRFISCPYCGTKINWKGIVNNLR